MPHNILEKRRAREKKHKEELQQKHLLQLKEEQDKRDKEYPKIAALSDAEVLDYLRTEEGREIIKRIMPERYEKGMELLRRFKEDRISFYKPTLPSKYEKQDAFHLSTAHVRCALGGNRVGKSFMGMAEAVWNSTCEYPEWYPQKMRWTAPTVTRIIVKDFEDSVMKVIDPLLRELMSHKFLCVEKKIGKIRRNTRGVPIEYTLNNGSKLHILCLRPDQRILMFNGIEKEVKDIKIGDRVICSNGETKVTNVVKSKVPNFYKVKTKYGNEVVCSENHYFLTENGWKGRKKKKIWKRVKELEIKKDILVNSPVKTRTTNNIKDWEALFLGILIGDGCLTSKWDVKVSCYDKTFANWMSKQLPDNLKLKEIRENEYNISQTNAVKNNPLRKLLKKTGMLGKKARDKNVPNLMFTVSRKAKALFLKGLFSTDGTFGGDGISYISRSKRLCEDIKKLLRHFGIVSHVYSYYRKDIFFNGYDCSGWMHYCIIYQKESIMQFAKYIAFADKEKKLSFDDFVKDRTPKNKNIKRKNYVSSIEKLEGGESFDISVEDNCHDYIVDGLISHNTHEQDTMQFEGAKFHNLFEDEPCPREKHVASMRGLIDYHGKCWMTLTPIGIDADWIYDDIYLADDPDIFWMNLDIRDNPYLSEEAIRQFEKQLSPDEIEARLHGKFMRMSGLVFKEWQDKEPYVIEPFQIPDDWTRIRAIDPHLRKEMAILWCAIDPDNNLYFYDELHMKGLVSIISERILEKTGDDHIQYTVIDNSANAPDVITGVNIRNEFARCGVPTLLASKDVISGINKIHEYLKLNDDKNSEAFGKPKTVMFKTLSRLRWEMKHYIWNPNKEEEEKVRKKDDDMIDDLRYIHNSRPFYRRREMDIDNYDDYDTSPITGYQRG